MRIDRLELQAFGPFHGRSLDLSSGRQGLHLIHGPNEAGKSSAMRAVRALFFGIPVQTSDNFLHSYDKLSLEATLRLADGSSLTVRRRKGKKGTLSRVESDGSAIPDDDALRPHFSGVDEAQFNRRYGLGRDELMQGGRALVEGRGDLGEALFTAGIGLAELKQLLARLSNQADELFLLRGKNPSINKALADLKERRTELQASEIAGESWTRQEMQVVDSRRKGATLRALRQARQAERAKLETLTNARPLLRRRQAIVAELATMRDVRALRTEFAGERIQADTDRRTAEVRRDDSAKTQADLFAQLKAMTPPGPLLEAADSIENLQGQLATHRKDLARRPQIADRLAAAEDDARTMLAGLRPDLTLDEVERLRPTRAQVSAIQALAQRRGTVIARRDAAREAIAQARNTLARLAGPDDSEAGTDPTRLAILLEAIEEARQAGDLGAHRAKLKAALDAFDAKTHRDLERLPGWTGSLAELEALCVPDAETIGTHEARIVEAEDAHRHARDGLVEAEEVAAQASIELSKLRRQGEVPTEADLDAARARRDTGWLMVRDAWLNRAGITDDNTLAQAFADAVAEADAVGDRLRREAERSAELAHARGRLDSAEHRLRSMRAKVRRSRRQLDTARTDWADQFWAGLGLNPLSPRETRTWLQRHQALGNQAEELRTRAIDLADWDREIDRHREALTSALKPLCPDTDDRAGYAPLAELLTRAQALANRLQASDEARTSLAAAVREAGASGAELDRWQADWAARMAPLGLDDDATPEAASGVLAAIETLLRKVEDRDKARRELVQIDAEAERFAEQARSPINRLAPDLDGRDIQLSVNVLYARLNQAREAQATREALIAQAKAAQLKEKAAEQAMNEATAQLGALCLEAGVDNFEELPPAEERSRRKRELGRQLAEIEGQLTELGGGMDVERLQDEVDALQLDPLATEDEFLRLDDELSRLDDELGEMNQAIGQQAQELARMDGAPTAARLNQEVHCLLARIESDAERYIQAQLASAVLRTAIDRYRQKNQDPILERARDLFATLTLGSFRSLTVDHDDKDGRPILKGVRADGRTVDVGGMSDGTADQLYLALRLASLESQLNPREPLPLLVDDILIQFDDARSVAALRALAELSNRTQVLMFTHHQHLLPLAQAELPEGSVFVHHLA